MSVGLDIGSKTIKVCELEKNGNNFVLKGSGVVGYKGETIDRLTDERDLAEVSSIIGKLAKAANISDKNITLALPESLVFTRTIRLPLLTDQEVASAIKWEAEQYIPIPIKEAIVQHQILERVERGVSPHVLVLLVAAPKVLVEKYIKVIQGARLNVVAVETELMSITRSLAPLDRTSLLIDFGARSVDVAITKSGLLAFSRSIPTGGEALTRALNQNLGISIAEAEEYKTTYGLSSAHLEGKIRQALEPVVATIIDEIKKAIHFYMSEEKGDTPVATIISGGTAGMPEMISYLTNSLGGEIQVANPFAKVQVSPDVWTNLAPYAPLYSVAVGLAMR